jgi:hypothetical protein
VALENLAAGRAEPGPVLLQAGLNSTVISEDLSAETRCIARAGVLLLRRALVLRESERDISDKKRHGDQQPDHHKTLRKGKLHGKRAVSAKVPPNLEPDDLPKLVARGDLQFEQRHPLQDHRVTLSMLRRAQDGFGKQIDLGR